MPNASYNKFDPMKGLCYGAILMVAIVTLGTTCYWLLGFLVYADEIAKTNSLPWTFFNCLYQTIITITTIGYGDILETNRYPIAALFTFLMAFIGMGVPVFMISMVSMLIIDGVFLDRRRKRQMRARIDTLTDHYILCGIGDTGVHILRELEATGKRYVIIDSDPARLQSFADGDFPGVLFLTGDATREEILLAAGIQRAKGIFACMGDDKENLFLTFIARRMEKLRVTDPPSTRPPLRIVSRAVLPGAVDRLLYAGANTTICPYQRGGIRMVSEMKTPAMTSFMDGMLSHPDRYRFDELTLRQDAAVIGQSLDDLSEDLAGLQVIAHRSASENATKFNYNPKGAVLLNPGDTIVVIGPIARLQQARSKNWE